MAEGNRESLISPAETTRVVIPEIVSQQLRWYDDHAGYHRAGFFTLKAIQIVASAAIPIVALIKPDNQALVNGVIGATILVIEGFQQLFQLQQSWTRYRSTAEGIRREQYLFQERAGPYAGATTPAVLIVERMDALISAENKGWSALQEQSKTAK